VFKNLFLAGFEGATGYNAHGEWIDQVSATHHDRFADEDYALVRAAGMRGAREAVRWPLVERAGRYDFSTLRPFLHAARRHGVKLVYDLFHFGYPDGVDLFSEEFPARFAEYCYAAARFVAAHDDGLYYFTPVNEPSFFAWAGGEAGLFAPHQIGRGWELKVCLTRAAIAGIEAIWSACPGARIVNVDPLCRVVAPEDRPDRERDVEWFNTVAVFQSWDMLAGRLLPEAGGSLRHLDIVGVNYYWTNQWEIDRPGVPLERTDPRVAPLSRLVRAVWERYGAEMIVTETSHVEHERPAWLREIGVEVGVMLDEGIPIRGVCLYPVLGMPEWHARDVWTRMGLWDLEPDDVILRRVAHEPTMEALREIQASLERRRVRAPPARFTHFRQARVSG
jgi:beta-glucosidase/6-phospho-beta-glucosidase/beta-galactosidase